MKNENKLARHLLSIGMDYDHAVQDISTALITDLYELLYKKDLISKTEIKEMLKTRRIRFESEKKKKDAENSDEHLKEYNQSVYDYIDRLLKTFEDRVDKF